MLEKWINIFNETRRDMQDLNERWDIDKKLFYRPKHMSKVLTDIKNAAQILLEFYSFLGEDL